MEAGYGERRGPAYGFGILSVALIMALPLAT